MYQALAEVVRRLRLLRILLLVEKHCASSGRLPSSLRLRSIGRALLLLKGNEGHVGLFSTCVWCQPVTPAAMASASCGHVPHSYSATGPRLLRIGSTT